MSYMYKNNVNECAASDISFDTISEVMKRLKYQAELSTTEYKPLRNETDEEKVIRLLKGDFEKQCEISFEKFMEIYTLIVKTSPEKLI